MFPRWFASASVVMMLALAPRARGVIILGDVTDPNGNYRNTTGFPGGLDQYIGQFGPYLGTPISSQYFITANHIGNAGGGVFTFNNGTSTTTTYDVTEAGVHDDLAIWQINQTLDPGKSFSNLAPLYTATNTEVGQPLVTIGRGTQRGAAINGPSSGTLAGWQWGSIDGVTSWGQNTVASIENIPVSMGGFNGNYLSFDFNNNGNPNTAIISDHDSGGPVFVQDPADNIYKLAGINDLVDVVQDSNGNDVYASLFDARGFYDGSTLITGASAVPESSYAYQISSELGFVYGVAGVPEPAAMGLLLVLAPLALARRRSRA